MYVCVCVPVCLNFEIKCDLQKKVISFCFKASHTTTLSMIQQQQQQAQQEQSAGETSTQ